MLDDSAAAAEFPLPPEQEWYLIDIQPPPLSAPHHYETAKPKRSCNRHDDCDAAEVAYCKSISDAGVKGPKPGEHIPNFHCHSDDCEDCLGK